LPARGAHLSRASGTPSACAVRAKPAPSPCAKKTGRLRWHD
jgi:hypothetical protein